MRLLPGIALSLAVDFGSTPSCKENPQIAPEAAEVTEATRLKLYSDCWDKKWQTTPKSQDFTKQDARDCYEAAGAPAQVSTVDAVNTQN